MPIYVVDLDYALYGTLDLFSLIKLRDDNRSTIEHIVNRNIMSFKASISIENILLHPAWEGNQMVLSQVKTILFLVLFQRVLSQHNLGETFHWKVKNNQWMNTLYFSELLWKNMQGIWDIFK